MLWLNRMMAQIAAVTEDQLKASEPKGEPCPHETVVGVLDPELQALYVLFDEADDRLKELVDGFGKVNDVDERKKLEVTILQLDKEVEVLRSMFWLSCADRFPDVTGKPEIGISKGWKLCWADHRKDLHDKLSKAFGLDDAGGDDGDGPRVRVHVVDGGLFGFEDLFGGASSGGPFSGRRRGFLDGFDDLVDGIFGGRGRGRYN